MREFEEINRTKSEVESEVYEPEPEHEKSEPETEVDIDELLDAYYDLGAQEGFETDPKTYKKTRNTTAPSQAILN